MQGRFEIRLSGSGGQGLVTAGIILAEAAGIHDGRYVCQTQSYGPEARGGASKAEVVISDREIDYPKAIEPDILLAMNQKSCDAYVFDLKPGGLLIVDASHVKQVPISRAVAVPFSRMAREETGRDTAANIVALGTLAAISGAVSLEGLEAAVLARVPRGTEPMNRKALEAGVRAGQEWVRTRK